jgi:hypothetical protein
VTVFRRRAEQAEGGGDDRQRGTTGETANPVQGARWWPFSNVLLATAKPALSGR